MIAVGAAPIIEIVTVRACVDGQPIVAFIPGCAASITAVAVGEHCGSGVVVADAGYLHHALGTACSSA